MKLPKESMKVDDLQDIKLEHSYNLQVGGGLIGYVKSKPLGNGQIISIDVLVDVMIIAVFHKKLI